MEAQPLNWIEFTALGVSIFMAIIAITSTLISFLVFRKNTSPEVIVYPDLDEQTKVVVNLIIKNIGNEVAKNVIFYPESELPCRAFGMENPEMPEIMDEGPIKNGIPYLAPGASRVLCWGQYGGLHKFIGDGVIKVTIKYERTNRYLLSKKLTNVSYIDIKSFETTAASDNSWGKSAVSELKSLNRNLANINKSIREQKVES